MLPTFRPRFGHSWMPSMMRASCTAAERSSLERLATVDGPIYWGSDGVSSVLYFAADSLEGVGVTRYGTGANAGSGAYVVGPPGAGEPPGFAEVRAGHPVWTNQAPDGAGFYYRFQGAPSDDDIATAVDIKGPAMDPGGLSDRDVFRDLEILWAKARRETDSETGSTTVRVPITILPERWSEVRRRTIDAEMLNEDGEPSFAALRDLSPTEPGLYQIVSGPLGTTVWVVGTVSGTRPALVLADPSGASPLEPFAEAPWASDTTDVRLHHFAYEPLQAGDVYEARYWHDEDAQDVSGPDYTWTAVVP